MSAQHRLRPGSSGMQWDQGQGPPLSHTQQEVQHIQPPLPVRAGLIRVLGLSAFAEGPLGRLGAGSSPREGDLGRPLQES